MYLMWAVWNHPSPWTWCPLTVVTDFQNRWTLVGRVHCNCWMSWCCVHWWLSKVGSCPTALAKTSQVEILSSRASFLLMSTLICLSYTLTSAGISWTKKVTDCSCGAMLIFLWNMDLVWKCFPCWSANCPMRLSPKAQTKKLIQVSSTLSIGWLKCMNGMWWW